MKPVLAIPILSLSIACVLGAQTVSVQVLERGEPDSQPLPMAEALVGGCLDGLFASGLIGTSQVVRVQTGSDLPTLSAEECAALEAAYVSYVIRLVFKPAKAPAGSVDFPEAVDYALYRAADGKVLHRGRRAGMQPVKAAEGGSQSVLEFMRRTGEAIALDCLDHLGLSAGGGEP
jgi:hypothetical protein